MSYLDYLPEDGNFSEGELWEAIAEDLGIDVQEIMDGDLVDFI
jgi:transketolase N-terminal domain/subunit